MSNRREGAQKGLFRRETKGLVTEPVSLLLDRRSIASFARILGVADPVFYDVAAARAQGQPDIVAPPSFAVVVEALAEERRADQGEIPLTTLLGCDFRYLLHGEQHYSYTGLLYAGDEVSVTTRIVDFYEKRGGLLEFAVLEMVIGHAARGPIVHARRILVHRLGQDR